VERIRLTLGVLPCHNADLQPDANEATADIVRLHEGKRIECAPSSGTARELQKMLVAEANIAWTGCRPAGAARCNEGDDAGR